MVTGVQDGTLEWAIYRACVVQSGSVPHSTMMYHGTRVQDRTLGASASPSKPRTTWTLYIYSAFFIHVYTDLCFYSVLYGKISGLFGACAQIHVQ